MNIILFPIIFMYVYLHIWNLRSRCSRSNSIAAKQRYNFGRHTLGSKRVKINNSWTHKLYCLSGADQHRLPSAMFEKNELVLAVVKIL